MLDEAFRRSMTAWVDCYDSFTVAVLSGISSTTHHIAATKEGANTVCDISEGFPCGLLLIVGHSQDDDGVVQHELIASRSRDGKVGES